MSTFLLIVCSVLLLGALISGGVALTTDGSRPANAYSASGASIKMGFTAGAVIALVVSVLLFAGATFREVPTNAIGVPTSFGHVESAMRPGAHLFVAPWTRVNIIDETIQTTSVQGSFGGNGSCDPLASSVRIGGQQQACADFTIKWQINDNGAPSLYRLYNKSGGNIMDEIQNNLVLVDLRTVVNSVLGDYNPIVDVSANFTAGNSQFSKFGPQIKQAMQQDLNGLINIKQFNLQFLHYDSSTESALVNIQHQFADTAVALELAKTNAAQAKANGKIGQPTVAQLQYLCYQIVQTAEKTGFSGLPATFSCQPGSTGIAVTAGK